MLVSKELSAATTCPPPRSDVGTLPSRCQRTLRGSEFVHLRVSTLYKPSSNSCSSSICSNRANAYAAAQSAPFTPSILESVKSVGALSLNASMLHTKSRGA